MTSREISESIKAQLDAIPFHLDGLHRPQRQRLKTKLLATVQEDQLFEVKTHLDNLLKLNRVGNKTWCDNHDLFFRKGK